jgi:serine O-acetyltransferase
MYNLTTLIYQWLKTNKPQKKIKVEIQLMYYFNNKSSFLRKKFERRLYYKYHCEISRMSKIDENVEFIHPISVIIGSRAVIEKDCLIYQNVTIGSDFNKNNEMPYIKRNTKIGAGAKLIGGIEIGENCIIGANAVVTKSVPNNSIVYGVNKIKSLY